MCKRHICIVLIGLTFSFYSADAGIRCANDIISTGDTDFQVKLKLEGCGELLDKQVIRKETVRKNDFEKRKEEKYIQRWHIRVQELGSHYCYPLIFEEGVLKEIGDWKKCK